MVLSLSDIMKDFLILSLQISKSSCIFFFVNDNHFRGATSYSYTPRTRDSKVTNLLTFAYN